MPRRGPLLVVAILAAAGLAAFLATKLRRRPVCVVLVTIDTLRADHVGAFGRNPTLTPNLDSLAAEGLAFENAWSAAPLTVPAHATIMTGRYPPLHGVRTNSPMLRLAPRSARDFVTLAEAMRGSGRTTAAFTSASCLRADRPGLDAGFDHYDEVPAAKPGSLLESERRGDHTVDAALAWLRSNDEPYFLWVHLWDPHHPYDAPVPFGAGRSHVSDAKGYDGEVAFVDHCLGRLIAGIRETTKSDVVFCVTSDHGEGLGEHGEPSHGFLLHEATLHVPLVIAAPTLGLPARRVADPVTTQDVAPTLLSLAGVPVPEGMSSRVLVDLRPGTVTPLYAETLYGHDAFMWAQAFTLRRGPLKIVDYGEEVLVYDLAKDPGEKSPVVHRPDAVPPGEIAVALEALHEGARKSVAAVRTDPGSLQGGGYFDGGRPISPFDAAENAKLASPGKQIWELTELGRAQTMHGMGMFDQALRLLDDLVERAPRNPQMQVWRARCLDRLGRYGEGFVAHLRAYDLGARTPEDVLMTLKLGLLAERSGQRPGSGRAALDLAARAAADGVPRANLTGLFSAELRLLTAPGDAEERRIACDELRAAASKETDVDARIAIADALVRAGDAGAALTIVDALLAAGPAPAQRAKAEAVREAARAAIPR